MPKNCEIKLDDYFNLPNPGLRSYFDNVRRGQPDEYRTTFAKGSSLQQVLEDWEPTLSKITDEWPSLYEFENDMRSKVGPLSIMKPLSERMDDIDAYYEGILSSATPIDSQAVKAVISEFKQSGGILVRSQSETVNRMRKSTNAGSPYFTKRRLVVSKTVPCDVAKSLVHQDLVYQDLGKHSEQWYACAVLGWRGQEGGPADDDVKQRVVWMFPFAVNICELQVYQPLIESAQRLNTVPAWVSMESVDRRVTQLFETKGPDDLVICTDFTKFDQHFNKQLQLAGRRILGELLTPNADSDGWLEYVYPIKYMIPLMYDYGKVRYGNHGMGSGSGGTNADETLVHRALQYEAAIRASQRLNPNSQCLGDDGIISYPGITVEDVVHSYSAHGLEMNEAKQSASKHDCVYLRRWHHESYRIDDECVGVYSTYRALGRLCEQERYYDPEVWSSTMVALRQLSIIENCKWHPLFEEFVDFCMKRDRYKLGVTIPGFLSNIDRIAAKATELMPDFLGYTKSIQRPTGLSSWRVVQYLKSKL